MISKSQPLFCALYIEQFPAAVLIAHGLAPADTAFVVARQNIESHKSVVIACSQPALCLGIHCGMPLYEVQRHFKQMPVMQRNETLEQTICADLTAALMRYTPDVCMHKTGECLLNLSRTPFCRKFSPQELGAMIRQEAVTATNLEGMAVGLARAPLVARIFARLARPQGVRLCLDQAEHAILDKLDTALIPGLSGPSRVKLIAYGLRCMGQLRQFSKEALCKRFGGEGELLHSLGSGLDIPQGKLEPPELTATTLFTRDCVDCAALCNQVRLTADKFCFTLKSAGQEVKSFTLSLRYSDKGRAQKTITLPQASNEFLSIARPALAAFNALNLRRVALCSITFSARRRGQTESGQLSLFSDTGREKQERLGKQILAVRRALEFKAVVSGSTIST